MDNFDKFSGEFKNESDLEEEFEEADLDYESEEKTHFDMDIN